MARSYGQDKYGQGVYGGGVTTPTVVSPTDAIAAPSTRRNAVEPSILVGSAGASVGAVRVPVSARTGVPARSRVGMTVGASLLAATAGATKREGSPARSIREAVPEDSEDSGSADPSKRGGNVPNNGVTDATR